MTTRKSFLRDCLLGIAVTLVPKILQPMGVSLQGEERWCVRWTRQNGEGKIIYNNEAWVRKEDADQCMWAMKAEADRLPETTIFPREKT